MAVNPQGKFQPPPLYQTSTSPAYRRLGTSVSATTQNQVEALKAACQEGSVENVRRCFNPLRRKLEKRQAQWPDIVRAVHDGRAELNTKQDLLQILLGYEDGRYFDADTLVKMFRAIMIRASAEPQEDNDDDDAGAFEEIDDVHSKWSQWAVGQIVAFVPQLMTYRLDGLGVPGCPTVLEYAITGGDTWVVPEYAQCADRFDADCLRKLSKIVLENSILESAAEIRGRKGLSLLKKLLGACKLIENIPGLSKLPDAKLAALLYAVISSGNLEMLQHLNLEYPTVFTLSHEHQTALQMLKSANLSSVEQHTEMERYIKAEILALPDMPLSEIRTLLGTEQELYLDLTQFDWEAAALNAFIARRHSLPIRLQDVLLHVHLPELVARANYDTAPDDPSKANTTSHYESQQSRKEAKDILDWLREKFEVNSIIELVVKDNLHDPHWEEVVEECLSPFSKIEHLNWRKIDLSMRSINAAKSLRELWLYSSGNWNSIAHWLGAEGLVSLPELRKVHLVFVKGLMSSEHMKKCMKYTDDKKRELVRTKRLDENVLKIQVVDEQGWPKHVPDTNRRTHAHQNRFPAQMLNLEKFLEAYRTIRHRRDSVTIKVAIIDTGIDLTDEKLARVVKKGVSFYQSDAGRKESPWYLPSDPHGSQMARIILDLCHDVELYIAKVATDRRSTIRQEDVKKALKWAADEKVDIVNMSMVIRDEQKKRKELEDIVTDAKFALIGSTADHGSYNSRCCFPCPNTDVFDLDDTRKTDVLTVAACDHLGTPLPTANRDAAFHLFGDRMAVKTSGAVDEVSGSSVATAVATGIAAISLSLSRYTHTEDDRTQALIIRKTFNRMKIDDKNSKYVSPESYFTPAPSVKAGEHASAWKDTSMLTWAKTAI